MSKPQAEHFDVCTECGATIYPEHVERNLAGLFGGRLLCIHCMRERREQQVETSGEYIADGIELIDDPPTPAVGSVSGGVAYDRKPTAIKAFGGSPGGMASGVSTSERGLNRALDPLAASATRCRTFHCKLADAAISHMNDQINEWADARDDVRIKFATSCIGVVEGKHADPHLIVTVFY